MKSNQNDDLPFTFRVGLEKQSIFQVEKQIISNASPVLDRMMNNGMKETDENLAELSEVTQLTFINFLHHAQSLRRTLVAKKPRLRYLENGPLIARLLDNGVTYFDCLKCQDSSSLAFSQSFPHCKHCVSFGVYMDDCHTACVVDAAHEHVNYRINTIPICGECCEKYDLDVQALRGYSTDSDDPGYLNARIQDIEKITLFRFDVPILASDISASMAYPSSCPTTLTTMKQAVDDWSFADIYEASSFKDLTISTLFEGLASSKQTSEDIASLTLYIYDETPDSGREVEFKDKNILRRMIASYIAYHCSKLQSSAEFRDMMCSGREVALDVWMAMGIISEGHIGKGWP